MNKKFTQVFKEPTAPTIYKRFIASIAANFLRGGVTFITGLLLARWLGPVDYGRMAFLLASFIAIRQLFDMSSSSAFFTFISQRPRSKRFINYYWRWVGIQIIVSLLIVGLILPDEIIRNIWQDETRWLVVLAFLAAFMQQAVWSVALQMAEAQRETIRVQQLNTIIVLIHLFVVMALWIIGQLALPLIFLAMAIEWGIAAWLATQLYRGHIELDKSKIEDNDTVQSVWLEFWHYCLPLIPYAWLVFVYLFADRWMLQHWSGSKEQAYYAVAFQFAGVALLATTSILNIFWKEIAEAYHNGDMVKVELLYRKISHGLYFISAVVAGGLYNWASEILELTVGLAYASGSLTLMLMFFYPVHQSIGQIMGAMLFATGKIYLQVIIGSVFMLLSLIVVYFILAPLDATIPGFELGSEGLAWKMVLLQIINVNVVAWSIARLFGWQFDWKYQAVGLIMVIPVGWLAKFIITTFWSMPVIFSMFISAVFYLVMITMIIYLAPWLIGMNREELSNVINNLKKAFCFNTN